MDNCPIEFLDYDKISDVLMYFSSDVMLKFTVQLGKRDQENHRRFFHREVIYESKYSNVGPVVSIKRDMNFFYSIEDTKDYMNNVMITIQDVYLLRTLIEANIIPWFIGPKNIFSTNPDDGKLVITGKWSPQQFTLSDYRYLEFYPIVLLYEDGKTNYGVRMIVNGPNTYADMDLNRFLGFYTIIAQSDMYAIASSMANYVKTGPYGVNTYSMLEEGRQFKSAGTTNRINYEKGTKPTRTKNFFDTV
jgi:hypothetical protein